MVDKLTLTEAESLTARTALLLAAQMATAAMARTTGDDRALLDTSRWEYLSLAERLA